MDSFFLTFRMFYQDQDEISLSRLTQRYRTLPINTERQKKWVNAYIAYKRFLKAKSTLVSGPVQHSRRAVLDMILYGHRAHVKLELRRKIEPWLANDGCRAILETKSAEILEAIIKHLIGCRAFNEETLAELAKVDGGEPD
jgi:hypothetical protein